MRHKKRRGAVEKSRLARRTLVDDDGVATPLKPTPGLNGPPADPEHLHLPMRLHVRTQDGVDARLVSALAAKPAQKVGIEALPVGPDTENRRVAHSIPLLA